MAGLTWRQTPSMKSKKRRKIEILLLLALLALLSAYAGSYLYFRLTTEMVHTHSRAHEVRAIGPDELATELLIRHIDKRLWSDREYDAGRAKWLNAFYWPARKLEELYWKGRALCRQAR